MAENGKRKLRLSKSTLRKLTDPELKTVQGGEDVHVTRGFTGCEYCGNTEAPDNCNRTYQCTYQDNCTDFFDETCYDALSDSRDDPICSMVYC